MIHNAYLESQVLSADPVELIRILYRGAVESVREAREHLANGEIAARSAAISKCIGILIELSASLNHSDGGGLSANLARLYDYMQQRLIQANLRQQDEPLAETLKLLQTLAEAWHGMRNPAEPVACAAAGFGAGRYVPDAAGANSAGSWSL